MAICLSTAIKFENRSPNVVLFSQWRHGICQCKKSSGVVVDTLFTVSYFVKDHFYHVCCRNCLFNQINVFVVLIYRHLQSNIVMRNVTSCFEYW